MHRDFSWWGNAITGQLEKSGRTLLDADTSRHHVFIPSATDETLLRLSFARPSLGDTVEVARVADGTVSKCSLRAPDASVRLCWDQMSLMADADGKRVLVVPGVESATLACFDAEAGLRVVMGKGQLAMAVTALTFVRAIDSDRLLIVQCDTRGGHHCWVVAWPQLTTIVRWVLPSRKTPRRLVVSSRGALVRIWDGERLIDCDLSTGAVVRDRSLYGVTGMAVDEFSGVCYVCQATNLHAIP